MTKIKVAHVLHSVGGVDVSLRLIVENINTDNFESIIVQGTQDNDTPFHDRENNTVKRYRLPIFREISPITDIKAIISTYKIIKREKPHVIHAHSAKGGVIGRFAGMLTGTPSLFTPQAYSYLSTNNARKRKIYLAIEKFFRKGKSYILASSESEKQRALKEVGFKPEKVLLYNNSIHPIISIHPLSVSKTWPDEYICTVGRPSYQKNTDLLVRAIYEVKKTRSIHLVLMGVGYHSEDLDSITALIKELGLEDNITMLPWTSREDVFNIVKNSQVYISTSRYEGLPYSVIEAIAIGKACVVSDCDGNRDLIIDNFNGFVIKDENPEFYANKIIRLLDDKELNDMFCKNAKEFFNGHFDVNKNITLLEAIYRDIAAKK
jgi:glycosyltransferase involved in cell wall biosynthesis